MAPQLGIDVSHYQSPVDWKAVAASGLTFGFCKVTEGLTFKDSAARTNLTGMVRAGMTPGGYHFLRAGNGEAQAETFLSTLTAVLPAKGVMLALDVERLAEPRPNRADVIDFAGRLAELTDDHPMIVYTGQTFWWEITGALNGRSRGWILWDAGTGEQPNAYVAGSGSPLHQWAKVSTASWAGYGGWRPADRRFLQYTAAAVVPGVPGKCDADAFFGDDAELDWLCGLKPAQPAEPEHPTTPTEPTTPTPTTPTPTKQEDDMTAYVAIDADDKDGNQAQYVIDTVAGTKAPILDSAESRALLSRFGQHTDGPVPTKRAKLELYATLTAPSGPAPAAPPAETTP